MKNTFLSLPFFVYGVSFAQFNLEHTYEDKMIKRVKLAISGEKYYYFDPATVKLHFFNANHTPWKTIPLPLPTGANITAYPGGTKFLSISETDINQDSLLEIVYEINYRVYVGNTGYSHFASTVINENGTVLFSATDETLKISKIDGLADVLITHSAYPSTQSKVYSMPNFVLQHTYPNGHVKRGKLDVSGEKYYLLNAASQQSEFYNAHHTIWKTVSTPKPPNFSIYIYVYSDISAVSEHMLNDDSLMEFAYGYGYATGSGYDSTTVRIIQENGTVLYEGSGSSFGFSVIPGRATKLYKYTIPGPPGSATITVFPLTSFTAEATYPATMVRENFENLGEKYYFLTNNWQSGANVFIKNADHSNWKTIPYTLPSDYHSPTLNHLSATVLNNDPLIEISYSYSGYFSNGGSGSQETRYQSKIINELGQELFFLDRASNLYVSSLPELENKVIADVKYVNMWNGLSNWERGEVYHIDLQLGLDEFERTKTVVFPNPASTVINIKASRKITNYKIFTIVGVLVKEIASDIDQVSLDGLSSGSYMLQTTDENQKTSVHKIIVTH